VTGRPPTQGERRCGARTAAALLALAVTCVSWPSAAGQRYDPTLTFRSLTTPHFVIYYHAGAGALASRLAVVAEEVHRSLTARMGSVPSGPTHLVLVDQDDTANGWAATFPVNTIEIAAAWPAAGSFIGNTDDWLRLVMVHEYAHIVHLDRSGGWARVLRGVFGRSPLTMPNLFAPQWQIEGIATYEESEETGRGRLFARDFTDLVDLPASTGRRLPIDQAGGGLVSWPGGHTSYAFGALFHEHLVRRFGRNRVAEFHRRSAGSFYFTGSRHARAVFGEPFRLLWDEFLRERAAVSRRGPETGTAVRRLTRHGFTVRSPRFRRPLAAPEPTVSRTDPAGTPWQVVYLSADADRFPGLHVVPADGSAEPQRLFDAYGTNSLAAADHLIVFDQVDYVRNVALRGDLYLHDRTAGRTVRLSKDARLVEPDLSPDGRSVAAVRIVDGRRQVAVYRLERDDRGRPRLAEPPAHVFADATVEYGAPRWSPDGRSLAASRQQVLGPSEIVRIDLLSGAVRVVVSRAGCRLATPAWMPDGRVVIASSDCEGSGFGLYAFDTSDPSVAPPAPVVERVLEVPGGALAPDTSPDGRWLAYVGATAEGSDVFAAPIDRAHWSVVATFGSGDTEHAPGVTAEAGTPGRQYSPWPTILPRWWSPTAGVEDGRAKLGAATSGTDVLGYHRYDASVAWWIERGGCAACEGTAPADWTVGYWYQRWTPSLFASVSRRTRLLSPERGGVDESTTARREDTWTAGVLVPRIHVRARSWLLAALAGERVSERGTHAQATVWRPSLRFGWTLVTARRYGFSVSPEDGLALAVTSEVVRPERSADQAAGAATGEVRGYMRLGTGHGVLAVRLAGGRAWGDSRTRRLFVVGGSGAPPALGAFGSDALDLLRGTGSIRRIGSRTALASIDLRWPVLRVERGPGLFPVFVRTVHAAGFVDAGHAWSGRFAARDAVASAGAEISADAVLGFGWPVTMAAGVAWVRDHAAGGWARRPAGFARLGYAF